MTRWVLAAAAAEDLERLVEFLLEQFPEDAVQTTDVITDALNILPYHPPHRPPSGGCLARVGDLEGQDRLSRLV